MKEELNHILVNEFEAVHELLRLLEEQHEYLLKNDVFALEECITKIESCNRRLADWEVKRRKLTKGESMNQIIEAIGDKGIEENYREIRKLLEITKLQKDTNELIIRQGLSFTNRILNILNPDRGSKTYNAYGKVLR